MIFKVAAKRAAKHSANEAAACFSLKETAVLAGVTEKVIRHEMADGVARPAVRAHGRVSFGPREVFYFCLRSRLPFELERAERESLFKVVTSREPPMRRAGFEGWSYDHGLLKRKGDLLVEISTRDVSHQIVSTVWSYLKGRSRVTSSPDVLGGEPVFAGTRVSVRHVGLQLKSGVPEAEVLEDFPVLRREDLLYARLFVELGRPPGRPRKLKFVRAAPSGGRRRSAGEAPRR